MDLVDQFLMALKKKIEPLNTGERDRVLREFKVDFDKKYSAFLSRISEVEYGQSHEADVESRSDYPRHPR